MVVRLILYHLDSGYQIYISSLNMFYSLEKNFALLTSLKFRSDRSAKMVIVVSTGLKDVRNLQSPLKK